MKARGPLLLLVCALVALPASAEAKPGYKVRPGNTELLLLVGEKGDYGLSVSANSEQRVRLAVEEGLASATYSTMGQVSSRRIEADFGDLGQVDIRVRLNSNSSERSRRGGRRCKGAASLYLYGTYRGAIEFAGEEEVPPFSSKRGHVLFVRHFRQICKRPPEEKQGDGNPGPAIELGVLRARAQGEGRTTLFEGFNITSARYPALSLGFAVGGAYERREGVRIARSAIELFTEGIVMSKRDKDPETVKVSLRNPFTGRARFSRSPGSPTSWTGNLKVKLPGAGVAPLTGPQFDTSLCRGSSEARVDECLYGSGSHSQPLALARLSSLR